MSIRQAPAWSDCFRLGCLAVVMLLKSGIANDEIGILLGSMQGGYQQDLLGQGTSDQHMSSYAHQEPLGISSSAPFLMPQVCSAIPPFPFSGALAFPLTPILHPLHLLLTVAIPGACVTEAVPYV